MNLIDPDGRLVFVAGAALGFFAYTGAMALADLTIAVALSYTAQQALEASRGKFENKDPNIYNKEKRKLKKGNACPPPKDPDPNKNPPPPIEPTLEQQLKRESLLGKVWRVLTSQFSQ